MQTSSTTLWAESNPDHNQQYDQLRTIVRRRISQASGPLFDTDAAGIYGAFLAALPREHRQVYECRACRKFADTHGRLAMIDDRGRLVPIIWDPEDAPPFFRAAVAACARIVRRARVTGVRVFGTAEIGVRDNVDGHGRRWWHFWGAVPEIMVYQNPLKTADQRAAELRADFMLLRRSLPQYDAPTYVQALSLLESGNLYRPEKTVATVRWFLGVKTVLANVPSSSLAAEHLLWRAVATAPAGFAHFKNGVLGTLLDDIKAGATFAMIERNWREKLDPTQYQRPSALPSEGNVKRAEEIVQRLASSGALARRYARLDEVEAIWCERPRLGRAPEGGVFAGVPTRGRVPERPSVEQPPVTMTWVKFRDQVLPHASTIEFRAHPLPDTYAAIVTAQNPEAPPILQWDREGARNPFSWYTYSYGSYSSQWGLQRRHWHRVTAVALQPSMWRGGAAQWGESVFFLLSGCRDERPADLCLFPEILRAEYREVRRTIEAHSRGRRLSGHEQASACGIWLTRDMVPRGRRFRVASETGTQTYVLDRWD